jgi:hypothetical protein
MDATYMHEFNPNRNGWCKTIIGGRKHSQICAGPAAAVAHVRYEANKPEPPFENFNVFVPNDCYELAVCPANPIGTMEEIRQFVEDAIKEKLERL